MSTLDRLLPASAFFSAASSVASLAWLKSSEPLSGTVLTAAEGLADALADDAAADEGVVAGALLELLELLEHAADSASSPIAGTTASALLLILITCALH